MLDAATQTLSHRPLWAQPSPRKDPRLLFLINLGSSLHAAGTPADRLEETLLEAARRLGVSAQFFSNPTSILSQFELGEWSSTHLERIEPGEVNLSKMVETDGVLADMARPGWSIDEGLSQLDEIAKRPSPYSSWVTIAAFGLASGSAARFFGGGLGDILASSVVALGAGALCIWTSSSPRARQVVGFLVAVLVSVLAVLSASLIPGTSSYIITVSGLIIFLPGLTLTVALTELATQHWVSGTARLMGAIVNLISLGFGVAIGLSLSNVLPPESPVTNSLPRWSEGVALILAPVSFVVLFRARLRDTLAISVCGISGYLAAKFVGGWLNPNIGAFTGAFTVGLLSNLHRRFGSIPAMVGMLPGIVLLVPGSLGFLSLYAFMDQDVLNAVDVAFRMMLVAISIVAGLLFANVAVRAPLAKEALAKESCSVLSEQR